MFSGEKIIRTGMSLEAVFIQHQAEQDIIVILNFLQIIGFHTR
jgi:hypothetical protein